MGTTANMSLTTWPDLTDAFDHDALAANFDAIDTHDHTTSKGVKVGVGGLANLTVGTAQIQNTAVITSKLADSAVTTLKLANLNVTTTKLADAAVTPTKIDAVVTQMISSPGDLKAAAYTTPDPGWLLCDGAAVSRATYSDLFAKIGTTFGVGNGTTTFNIPDGRGRPLYGVGTHADLDTLGDNEGSIVANRRASHNHSLGAHTHDHAHTHPFSGTSDIESDITGINEGGGLAVALPRDPHTHDFSGNTVGASTVVTSGPSGPSDATNVPYLAVNYFIKT